MISFDIDGTLCPKWWENEPDQDGILARFALALSTPSLQLEFVQAILLVKPTIRPTQQCAILSARPHYLFYATKTWLEGHRFDIYGAPMMPTTLLTSEEAGHWKAQMLNKLMRSVRTHVDDDPIICEILKHKWHGVVLTPEQAINKGLAMPISQGR